MPPPMPSRGGGGSLGPPSARAGPRIFVGKLNKETSEQVGPRTRGAGAGVGPGLPCSPLRLLLSPRSLSPPVSALQDVKDYFLRFGFVMDVYLPRGERVAACACSPQASVAGLRRCPQPT